jgi:predicted ATPase
VETTGGLQSPHNRDPYVFLSYASTDRERALHVADLLEANGVSVWIDRKNITGGASWSGEIVHGIRDCAALVVAGSVAAMASPNVHQEIQLAWETRRPILPLLLEPVSLPDAVQYVLAGRQWIEVGDQPDGVWLPQIVLALANLGLPPTAQPTDTHPPLGPTHAAQSAVPRLANVPVPLTPFIGRANDVAAIRQRVLRADVHLVTLTGPGGTGKTRLSLEVARLVADAFPDGVVFISLGPLQDSALVVPTLVHELGLVDASEKPDAERLQGFLHNKTLLLLMDNFEHLLDAAPGISDLLQRCPNLKVLATSRSPLRVSGEQEYAVSPLALPTTPHLAALDELLRFDAIRLFHERAQAVKADFDLNADNAAAVVEICRRLDGLPLAIELAAVRIRLLTPQQILSRLDHRLSLLTGGARDAPSRQQTLRATIAWSYDLLAEEEKALFRRLAIFVGGVTLEAAEAVAGPDLGMDVLDGLESLTRQSLLRPSEVDGAARFQMLDTVHEFGQERLDEHSETETIHRGHATYFRKLAEETEPRLATREQGAFLDQLEREHSNLRAALGWLAEHDPDWGLRLATSLRDFWFTRGYRTEGCRWLRTLLPAAPERTRPRAQALHALGQLIATYSDEARAPLEESLAIYREIGDRVGIAAVLGRLGLNLQGTGDLGQARAYLKESIVLARHGSDLVSLALGLAALGQVEEKEGHYDWARPLYEESLGIGQRIGEGIATGQTLGWLANLARLQGDYNRAQRLFEEVRALAGHIGHRLSVAWATSSLGYLAQLRGDLPQARTLFLEALHAASEVGETSYAASCLASLGVLAIREGNVEPGIRLLSVAQTLFPRLLSTQDADELADYEARLREARSALSTADFDHAWAEGQAMTLEQAIAYTLSDDNSES